MIESFKKYLYDNKILILLSVLLYFLAYIIWIVSNPLHVDTFQFINLPNFQYNWLQIDRWGLCLFKYISNGWFLNLFFEKVIGYLFCAISGVILGYTGFYFTNKFKLFWIFFPVLIFCNPFMADLFYFDMQMEGIGFGFILISLSLLLNMEFIFNFTRKNFIKIIIGILMGIWAFGIYQSFINTYISFFCLIFILKNFDNFEVKILFKQLFLSVVIFLSIFLLYRVVCILTNINPSSYNEITWGQDSIVGTLLNIYYQIRILVINNDSLFNVLFSVLLFAVMVFSIIALIVRLVKTQWAFIFVWISIMVFEFSSVVLLFINGGSSLPLRSFTALLFVFAGNILLVVYFVNKICKYNKAVLLILFLLVCFGNLQGLESYIYTDIIRSNEDISVMTELAYTTNRLGNKPVAIIGNYNNHYTPISKDQKGTCSWSVFYWGDDSMSRTSHVSAALKSLGIKDDLNLASKDNFVEATRVSMSLDSYPNGQWYKDMGDYIIINIGKK